jgi:hypothetical protein
MFHGIKKKEKKELTEDEIKALDEKIAKIKHIQNDLLERRTKREYFEENLINLLKAAALMPDFSTIWAYRKETILHLRTIKTDEEFIKLLTDDIKNMQKLMQANPKSYVLWYHRYLLLILVYGA